MKEFSLISEFFRPLTNGAKEAQNLQDDTAIFSGGESRDYIITLDTICENTHFLSNAEPEVVANRLIIPNLSDLASSGAKPLFYLMTGNITAKQNEQWYQKFCKRLSELQAEYGFNLIGGDTVKASNDDIFLSATFLGEVEKGKNLKRDSAKTSDNIYVSGKIGGGYLGLKVANQELDFKDKNTKFLEKYQSPKAQILLGLKLTNIANSCTDISDGLVKDLNNICEASKVSAEIILEQIPLFLEGELVVEQLSGGDDYELIFTANKSKDSEINDIAKKLGVKITKIGKITDDKQKKVAILNQNFEKLNLEIKSYEH